MITFKYQAHYTLQAAYVAWRLLPILFFAACLTMHMGKAGVYTVLQDNIPVFNIDIIAAFSAARKKYLPANWL